MRNYFFKTAKKSEIFKKTNSLGDIYVRQRSQTGMGVLICFYLSIIVAFPVMHLLFLLNFI